MNTGSKRFGAEPGSEAKPVDLGAIGTLMAGMRGNFSATKMQAAPARGFASAPAAPKHFTPADPASNPTEGWDPFDPTATPKPEIVEKFDPLSAARSDGFADGLAAARGEAEAIRIAETAAIERLVESLQNISGFDRDSLAARLRQTVLHLVTRLVGDVGLAPELMEARIRAAVGMIADSTEIGTIRLHPDDLKLLEGRMPERLTAIADPSVEPGGIRVETRTGVIEDSPSQWLGQLAAAIDKTALPDAA